MIERPNFSYLQCFYLLEIFQTKFFTGCGPILTKSYGIGDTRSSLPITPASARPFLHILANLSALNVAELVVVNKRPSFLTSGAASETSSAISLFTLHLFFFFPTEVLGGSSITISNCSPLFANRASQSKPVTTCYKT